MMSHASAPSPAFWDAVADHVTDKVKPVLRQPPSAREPVITYLRELEVIARRECDSREIIQIIASGRHLLGDRSEVGPEEGLFSRI